MSLLLSLIMGSLGIYFIYQGKHKSDTRLIILGAVLILASYWMF